MPPETHGFVETVDMQYFPYSTKACETLGIERIKRYRLSGRSSSHTLSRLRIVEKPRPILIDIHGHILPGEVIGGERKVIYALVVDLGVEDRSARCGSIVGVESVPVVEAVVGDEWRGIEVEACGARGGGCLGGDVE